MEFIQKQKYTFRFENEEMTAKRYNEKKIHNNTCEQWKRYF